MLLVPATRLVLQIHGKHPNQPWHAPLLLLLLQPPPPSDPPAPGHRRRLPGHQDLCLLPAVAALLGVPPAAPCAAAHAQLPLSACASWCPPEEPLERPSAAQHLAQQGPGQAWQEWGALGRSDLGQAGPAAQGWGQGQTPYLLAEQVVVQPICARSQCRCPPGRRRRCPDG